MMAVSPRLSAQVRDTLRVSDSYTVHVVFGSDIDYVDLSNPSVIDGGIVHDQEMNQKPIIALRAVQKFASNVNLTVLESNMTMHMFILVYDQDPDRLVIDLRENGGGVAVGGQGSSGSSRRPAQGFRRGALTDSLEVMLERGSVLRHLSDEMDRIEFSCIDIRRLGSNLVFLFELRNNSGFAFNADEDGVILGLENRRAGLGGSDLHDRKVPVSVVGSMNAAAGETTRLCLAVPRFSIMKGQCLWAELQEADGRRVFRFEITRKDLARAKDF